MDLRHGRTCVFAMHVHLAFFTKYRRKGFTEQVMRELKLIVTSVCKEFESTLIEFDGEQDHVHSLVSYPPKTSVSKLVNSQKGVSSRLLRNKGILLFTRRFGEKFSGRLVMLSDLVEGAPISIIRQYIENQQSPSQ